jgi:hypothetical protein
MIAKQEATAEAVRPQILTAAVDVTNADLIARVASVYLKPGMRVADITFGRGIFWKKTDLGQLECFTACDLHPDPDVEKRPVVTVQGTKITALIHKHDFRKLPDEWSSLFDLVVFDPPYMHGGASVKASIRNVYKNDSASTKYASHAEILGLYRAGMAEAFRILKPRGFLWVKCQDEIESGKQKWSHIEIFLHANALGFEAVDLFVMVQATIPARRLPYQKTGRKNHSYMWVFRKKRVPK